MSRIYDMVYLYNWAKVKAVPSQIVATRWTQGDELMAGCVGYLFLGGLEVVWLWVDEKLRGQKIGTRLLCDVETIAHNNRANFSHLCTFDFQARGFYERNGYRVTHEVDGYHDGHVLYHMRKDF